MLVIKFYYHDLLKVIIIFSTSATLMLYFGVDSDTVHDGFM